MFGLLRKGFSDCTYQRLLQTSLQLPSKILLYIQFFPHDLELAYNQQLPS